MRVQEVTMRLLIPALASLSVLFATPSQAGLRCGHELVQEGESTAQLLLACGDPMLRQTITTARRRSATAKVEEQWTYNFGPGTLLQIVTLEGGRISKIEDGERQ
jgi:hypothetical protein